MPKSKPFKVLLLAAALTCAAPVTLAAPKVQPGFKHYITDRLQVPIRKGPGFNYKIKNLLTSGTPVVVLEVNKEGWARVEYTWKGQKRDGWMPARLLSPEPVAREQLKQLAAKNAELNTRLQQLEQQLTNVRQSYEETKKLLSDAQKKLFTLKKEYEHLRRTAGNAVALDEENQKLKQQVAELEERNAMLNEQITHSEDAIKRQWFLTGAGVLLLGLLLGRFFRMPRRRSSWDEL